MKVGKNSAGWLVKQIARKMDAEMAVELKKIDLDIRLFANLMTLNDQDGLTQAELGQRVGEAQYTTSRLVDNLEDRKLVKRKKDPESRRSHRIELTKSGRAVALQLPEVIKLVNEKVLENLSKKEQQQFISLLQKVLKIS